LFRGGTGRNVLLDNHPVFWLEDTPYLLVILGAAGATLIYGRFFTPPRGPLLVADAFGLALFTFIGARAAYAAGAPASSWSRWARSRVQSSKKSSPDRAIVLLLHHPPLRAALDLPELCFPFWRRS
jgi:hypothetical protein